MKIEKMIILYCKGDDKRIKFTVKIFEDIELIQIYKGTDIDKSPLFEITKEDLQDICEAIE